MRLVCPFEETCRKEFPCGARPRHCIDKASHLGSELEFTFHCQIHCDGAPAAGNQAASFNEPLLTRFDTYLALEKLGGNGCHLCSDVG